MCLEVEGQPGGDVDTSLELRAGLEVASGVRQGWMAFVPESEETARLGHPLTSRRDGWWSARPGGLPIAIPGSLCLVWSFLSV